jgi:hypothetical protein
MKRWQLYLIFFNKRYQFYTTYFTKVFYLLLAHELVCLYIIFWGYFIRQKLREILRNFQLPFTLTATVGALLKLQLLSLV